MHLINDCPIVSAPYKNPFTRSCCNIIIKKNGVKLILSFLLFLFFLSCKKGPVLPTEIKLVPAGITKDSRQTGGSLLPNVSLTLKINQIDTLRATIIPANVQSGITWTSSNAAIVTVDQFGVVKGMSLGTALITARTNEGNASAVCRVTVGYWTKESKNVFINSIAIDAIGFKWCGTTVGLAWFSNSSWITYNTGNSGLADNLIHDVKIDAQGKIWMATEKGVSSLDGSKWATYSTSNSGLANNIVYAIAIDPSGNKWFGTNSGISKFDGVNWTSLLSNKSIYALAVDAQGTAWICGNGLWSFKGNSLTNFYSPNFHVPIAGRNIYSIAIDAKGNKWFGTDRGVAKFDGTNWSVYTTANSGLADNWVTGIAIDGQGNKWFSTLGGVSMFDDTNWTVYNATKGPFAFGTGMNSIAIDQQGNKIVGSSLGLIWIYTL